MVARACMQVSGDFGTLCLLNSKIEVGHEAYDWLFTVFYVKSNQSFGRRAF